MNVDFDCPIKLPSLSLANTVVTPHLLEVVRDGGLERLDLSFQVVTSNVEPKPLPSEQVCRLEEFYRLFLEVAGCKLDPITSVQLTVELVVVLLKSRSWQAHCRLWVHRVIHYAHEETSP